jgi:hypothetical protein
MLALMAVLAKSHAGVSGVYLDEVCYDSYTLGHSDTRNPESAFKTRVIQDRAPTCFGNEGSCYTRGPDIDVVVKSPTTG